MSARGRTHRFAPTEDGIFIMLHSVTVSVPATLTNLGAGFDSLGLAVSVFNRMTAEVCSRGLEIEVAGEGKGTLPENRSNLAVRVMEKVFKRARKHPQGLRIRMDNQIPVGRGMGSSSACIVASLLAVSELTQAKLSREEILEMALDVEGHPDNILPAVVGGFTVAAMNQGKLVYARHDLTRSLHAVLVVPENQILTRRARRVLPKKVPFADAVFNLSRSALTVSALTQGRLDLLKVSMQDRLHQPYRRKLFPLLTRILEILERSGGKGFSVSGSGPTAVTFVEGSREAHRVAAIVRRDLRKYRIRSAVWIAGCANEGARVVARKK